MSEKQLNESKPTESALGTTELRILSGHDDPQGVVETTAMHWLGAEGIVVYPEGEHHGSPR